jgi:hypothetical protein
MEKLFNFTTDMLRLNIQNSLSGRKVAMIFFRDMFVQQDLLCFKIPGTRKRVSQYFTFA